MRDADTKQKHEDQRMWLTTVISQLQAIEWFGSITIKFEKGSVSQLQKIESLKPPVESKNGVRVDANPAEIKR